MIPRLNLSQKRAEQMFRRMVSDVVPQAQVLVLAAASGRVDVDSPEVQEIAKGVLHKIDLIGVMRSLILLPISDWSRRHERKLERVRRQIRKSFGQ